MTRSQLKSNLSLEVRNKYALEINILFTGTQGQVQTAYSTSDLDGLSNRLGQVIAHLGINQSEFARRLGTSPGFVSDAIRGLKKPGAEFLFAVRQMFGISIDWLLTGQGNMYGVSEIDLDLLALIRLQIQIVRLAIVDANPLAKELLSLIRNGRLQDAKTNAELSDFLRTLAAGPDDFDLALELYNGHIGSQNPGERQQILLAATVAHFETRKPRSDFEALARTNTIVIQINTGPFQRNAGRDSYKS